LVLNNDTKIFKGSIEQLLETIKKRKATAISPLIYEKENKIWYAGGEYSWYGYKYLKEPKDYKDCYPTNVYSGCCVIFKTYEYLKMGGMEDSLFISIDEPEFSRRIKKQKGKILVEPRAKIFHEVGRSIGKRGSRYHDYFWVRNRYIYSSLHNNFFFHLSFLIIYTLLRVLKWGIYFFKKQGYRIETEFLGVKDYFKKNWGAGSLLKELSALDFKYLQKNYG
jgi:GT2 family glycosyltransferase